MPHVPHLSAQRACEFRELMQAIIICLAGLYFSRAGLFDDSLLLRLALNIDLYFAMTINAISFGLLYCTEVLQLQICAQYIILACVFIILRTCKSFFFPLGLEFALLRQPRGYLVVRLTSIDIYDNVILNHLVMSYYNLVN